MPVSNIEDGWNAENVVVTTEVWSIKSALGMFFDALIVGGLATVGGVTAVIIAPSPDTLRVATAQVLVTFLSAFLYQLAIERGLKQPKDAP